jgi:hypothetical protein
MSRKAKTRSSWWISALGMDPEAIRQKRQSLIARARSRRVIAVSARVAGTGFRCAN